MRTSLAGKRNSGAETRRRGDAEKTRAGVTLIELLIVMTIIGLVVGISFPSISSGLESVRLSSASTSLVGFFNGALNRAERRQEVMEVVISPKDNTLWMYAAEPGFARKLQMPDGVTIAAVLPEPPEAQDAPRRFLLMPGSVPPRIGVELINRRGARRIVRIDPITGVPQIEVLESK